VEWLTALGCQRDPTQPAHGLDPIQMGMAPWLCLSFSHRRKSSCCSWNLGQSLKVQNRGRSGCTNQCWMSVYLVPHCDFILMCQSRLLPAFLSPYPGHGREHRQQLQSRGSCGAQNGQFPLLRQQQRGTHHEEEAHKATPLSLGCCRFKVPSGRQRIEPCFLKLHSEKTEEHF
jgi:hypothetical protein